MPKQEIPEVKPGQVWADNDPRSQPRKIQVLGIVDGKAVVRTHTYATNATPGAGRRTTQIRLDRFNPNRMTGYSLLGEEDIPDV